MPISLKLLVLTVFVVSWIQVHLAEDINPSDCGRNNFPTTLEEAEVICVSPWVVFVVNLVTNKYCTGSLLSYRHVAMSKFCLDDSNSRTVQADKIKVYYRTNFSTLVHVQGLSHKVYRSPRIGQIDVWISSSIAVVKLADLVNGSSCARPVCLPKFGQWEEKAIGCHAAGWSLRHTVDFVNADIVTLSQRVVPFHKCGYAKMYDYWDVESFCTTGNSNPCLEETGVAFTCNQWDHRWYLYGIGFYKKDYKCKDTWFFSYKRISTLHDWIREAVASL